MRALHASAIRVLPALLVLSGFPDSVGQAQSFLVGQFRPWAGYAIPNGLWLSGDFNADGRADVLHAVANSDYAHIWTSNGSGGFAVGTFRPWPGYAIPNGIWLVGDFNGDGRSDVFHAVANTDYAHIWTASGSGSFTVTTFRPWSGYAIPNGIWLAGDFNGDKRTDIFHAVANTDYAHIWTANATGGFTVSTFRPWAGYAIPNGVWLVGDFNGDGQSDILHAVANTDYAHTWTSSPGGGFTVGTFRPWAGYAIPNGLWIAGDYNGDGRTDVLHAVANTDYTHVWTAGAGGGFTVGTFRPWVGYAIPNGLWIPGDYDGDGRTDILHAVQGTDYSHLWRSTGAGGFNVSTFSPWPGYAIPNGLWLPGDISGDGKMDIVHAVQATDYVHPWISGLAGPTPGGGQVALDGVEVTQAIQDMAHSVTLVAGKTTVARAYLSTGSTSPRTVRGVLSIRDIATGSVTTVNSNGTVVLNPAQNGQLRPKRENLAAGLIFPVPAAFTSAGVKEFTLSNVTDVATAGAIACPNCAGARAVRFVSSSPLRLRVVGLQYTTGTPPTTITRAPAAIDFTLVRSWALRAYPIAQLIATQVTLNATGGGLPTCGQANAQLSAQRALDVAGGTDARTHYVGIVSAAGGYMRGCSSGIPAAADPTVVASSPTGPPTGTAPINVGGDTDGSFGDWYNGHELAHTFGRLHPGFCNGNSSDDPAFPFPNGQLAFADGAYTGLDVGDATNSLPMTVLPGASRFEIMTYCNQPQWLTAYTYLGIRGRLNAESPAGTGAPGGGPVAGPSVAAAARAAALRRVSDPACPCPPRVAPSLSAPPRPVLGARRPAEVALQLDSVPPVPTPAAETPTIPEAGQRIPDARPAAAAPPAVERGRDLLPSIDPGSSEPPPQVQLRQGAYVSIIATVNLTKNTAEVRFVNRLTRALVPVVPQNDRAHLRVTDAQGKVIGDYNVWLREDTDIPPGEDRTALIDAVIPYQPETARIELLLSGRRVAEVRPSKTPPAVTGVRLTREDRKEDPAQQPGRAWTVTWSGKDADGDSLTYTVQVSSDQGRTWETLAIGQAEDRFTLSESQLWGRRPTHIRIFAGDGWWSSKPVEIPIAEGGTAR